MAEGLTRRVRKYINHTWFILRIAPQYKAVIIDTAVGQDESHHSLRTTWCLRGPKELVIGRVQVLHKRSKAGPSARDNLFFLLRAIQVIRHAVAN